MRSRALYAGGLLAALVGALLVAWFFSGWSDVRARQRAVRDAPAAAAAQRASELAHELRGELGTLITREVERPYFHYQNLFHDPRASEGPNVTPSPLARRPDGMVLGYFQLDARGRTTTPTINDELPELSEPSRLPDHRRFRDEVARSLAGTLAPPRAPAPAVVVAAAPQPPVRRPVRRPAPVKKPVQLAQNTDGEGGKTKKLVAPPPAQPAPSPPPSQPPAQPAPSPPPPEAAQAPSIPDEVPAQVPSQVALPPAQIVTLDSNSYAQNVQSNEVYRSQKTKAEPPPRPARRGTPKSSSSLADVTRSPVARLEIPQAPPTTPLRTVLPSSSKPAQRADESPARGGEDQASTKAPRAIQTARAPDEVPAGKKAAPRDPDEDPPPARPAPRRPDPAPAPVRRAPAPAAPAPPPGPITITVSPLEWRTMPFAGQPAMVAVRQVETPDGGLAQGFVIDRTALTSWLASHAGDAIAELRTGDNGTTEIVPGWHLEVAANPRAVLAAAADASSLARGFVLRFSAIGVIAIVAALLVVMLVARAERLARERSQFAAAAAHELRTPLAGLQLYGDMLADGLGDPSKMRDYARRMSEEASRLGRVVSNVLGFSQLERGNLSVTPRVAPLDEPLRELVDRARPALDRAGATLALDLAPDLTARFDRDALARIIGNLLDNAEKYSRGATDRTITLTARLTAQLTPAALEIVVSDHGPGIPPAARARLFRPFARGVSSDGPAGLGLGLALSQSLARAMGGDLAYRPVPDGGAAFTLTLSRA